MHAGVVCGAVPDLAHEADLRAEVVVELRAAARPRHAAVVAGVDPGPAGSKYQLQRPASQLQPAGSRNIICFLCDFSTQMVELFSNSRKRSLRKENWLNGTIFFKIQLIVLWTAPLTQTGSVQK